MFTVDELSAKVEVGTPHPHRLDGYVINIAKDWEGGDLVKSFWGQIIKNHPTIKKTSLLSFSIHLRSTHYSHCHVHPETFIFFIHADIKDSNIPETFQDLFKSRIKALGVDSDLLGLLQNSI